MPDLLHPRLAALTGGAEMVWSSVAVVTTFYVDVFAVRWNPRQRPGILLLRHSCAYWSETWGQRPGQRWRSVSCDGARSAQAVTGRPSGANGQAPPVWLKTSSDT